MNTITTLTKRIIPCLDVKDGRVVKGVNFLDLIDAGDPVEVAKRYNEEGADEICFLDITASHEKRKTIYEVVEKVAKQVFIPLTVGGGISTIDDIRNLLSAGADKVSINSAAVRNPEIINLAAQTFGSQCIVIAIDAKSVLKPSAKANIDNTSWNVFTLGGRKDEGIDVIDWAEEVAKRGAGEILLTSMDKDGTKSGFDNILNRAVSSRVNIPLIASGGVGTLQHLADGILEGGADAVLAASIFHFREFNIKTVKEFLQSQNINVRI